MRACYALVGCVGRFIFQPNFPHTHEELHRAMSGDYLADLESRNLAFQHSLETVIYRIRWVQFHPIRKVSFETLNFAGLQGVRWLLSCHAHFFVVRGSGGGRGDLSPWMAAASKPMGAVAGWPRVTAATCNCRAAAAQASLSISGSGGIPERTPCPQALPRHTPTHRRAQSIHHGD